MSKGENTVERPQLDKCAEAAFWAHVAATEAEILGQWSMVREKRKAEWAAVARAVIEALMEPTPEMLKAGTGTSEVDAVDWVGALFGTGVGSYEEIMVSSHQAMLRTILSQPNDEGEGK